MPVRLERVGLARTPWMRCRCGSAAARSMSCDGPKILVGFGIAGHFEKMPWTEEQSVWLPPFVCGVGDLGRGRLAKRPQKSLKNCVPSFVSFGK
jgi:hypothetical protein